MNQSDRTKLMNEIREKYKSKMYFCVGTYEGVPYSIVMYRMVFMPQKAYSRPSAWNIMCLLHEIGHIMTNEEDMPEYMKEYLAIQWSAEEANRIKFDVEDIWKDCFQQYIYDYLEKEPYKKRKEVDKRNLMVRW